MGKKGKQAKAATESHPDDVVKIEIVEYSEGQAPIRIVSGDGVQRNVPPRKEYLETLNQVWRGRSTLHWPFKTEAEIVEFEKVLLPRIAAAIWGIRITLASGRSLLFSTNCMYSKDDPMLTGVWILELPKGTVNRFHTFERTTQLRVREDADCTKVLRYYGDLLAHPVRCLGVDPVTAIRRQQSEWFEKAPVEVVGRREWQPSNTQGVDLKNKSINKVRVALCPDCVLRDSKGIDIDTFNDWLRDLLGDQFREQWKTAVRSFLIDKYDIGDRNARTILEDLEEDKSVRVPYKIRGGGRNAGTY